MPSQGWWSYVIKSGALLMILVSFISPERMRITKDDLAVVFIVFAALACAVSLFTRAVLVAAIAVTMALLGMVSMSAHVLSDSYELGQAYPSFLTSLGLVIVGAAVTPKAPALVLSPREEGDLVDRKRHGRWYSYDAKGNAIEMTDYEHVTMVTTTKLTPK